MNSLERSLIEKTGCDKGWEIAASESPTALRLSSARHDGQALVEKEADSETYIFFPCSADVATELTRAFPMLMAGEDRLRVIGTYELGKVLQRAAQLFYSLPDRPAQRFAERAAEMSGEELKTEIERTILQRLRQDEFRAALLSYWQGACAVTGIDLSEILRASHAKPWADCQTDVERLNVFNGFLLSANFDALFDRGLITFDDTGKLICSTKLTETQKTALGLPGELRLRWLDSRHLAFLHWHRQHVFTG